MAIIIRDFIQIKLNYLPKVLQHNYSLLLQLILIRYFLKLKLNLLLLDYFLLQLELPRVNLILQFKFLQVKIALQFKYLQGQLGFLQLIPLLQLEFLQT